MQFFDNGTSLGIQPLNSGVATITTTFATAATHPITAVYLGDTNFAGNTSPVLNEAVVVPGFGIAVNPNTITIARGNSGTATLTFTPVGNYQGSLTMACNNLPALHVLRLHSGNRHLRRRQRRTNFAAHGLYFERA